MDIKLDYSDVSFKNNGKLKLLIIVGTRPEIIRLAAVITKCRQYFDCVLAHTGQNYDYNLNGVFFKDLKLENPEVYMDAVGDDLGATVGNIINCSYKLMNQIKPDALLILGDTNSCLSAISAKRLHTSCPRGVKVTICRVASPIRRIASFSLTRSPFSTKVFNSLPSGEREYFTRSVSSERLTLPPCRSLHNPAKWGGRVSASFATKSGSVPR